MASLLLNILPMRVYDFSSVLTNQSQTVTVAERIDISQYCDGVMIVRTHSADCSGGGSILVQAVADGYTRDDPTISFQFASVYFSLPIGITGVVTVPTVQASAGAQAGFGGAGLTGQYAAMLLTASQGLGGSLKATLSIDLLLRNPDEFEETSDLGFAKRCGCQRRK